MKIYRRYAVLIALIALITGWHLVLCEPFRSGIVCLPNDDDCTVRVTRTINPLTDVLTMRASSPAHLGAADTSPAAEFRGDFVTAAESAGENQLRHYARRYFDLYAMLLPYSVIVDMGATTSAKVETGETTAKKEMAMAKWPEVETAEWRLFGARTAEVDTLEVMSENLQGTVVVSTRCMAHFCGNHSAAWVVDLSTGKAAGEITSDGVMDKSGKAEMVICLGDYENSNALPPMLQEDIKGTLSDYPQISVRYVPQIP